VARSTQNGYSSGVDKKTFHHGNLRAELLERAEAVLRARGAEELSLRELAREAGVSHGAPRSHFPDRRALLDALAERGFYRLADAIDAAVRPALDDGGAGTGLLRAAAGAYLDFATGNPALIGIMVASKTEEPSIALQYAGTHLLSTMTALVTTALGKQGHDAAQIARLTLLLSATAQGVSALVVSGRIEVAQGHLLLDDAVRIFVAGAVAVDGSVAG
jgi:AcrR family transcriptional regulator